MLLQFTKDDIVLLLKKSLDLDITDKDVKINNAPFSLEIKDVPFESLMRISALKGEKPDRSTDDDEFGEVNLNEVEPDQIVSDTPSEQNRPATLEELMARNQQLAASGTRTTGPGSQTQSSVQTPLERVLHGNESYDPPEITESELRGHRGGF